MDEKSRFNEEQIIGVLKQHEAGSETANVLRQHVLSVRPARKLLDLKCGSCRYEPRPDRNAALRSELLVLARQSLGMASATLCAAGARTRRTLNDAGVRHGACWAASGSSDCPIRPGAVPTVRKGQVITALVRRSNDR